MRILSAAARGASPFALSLALALSVAGCSGRFDFDPPAVDRAGIDGAKYDRDVAECIDAKISAGLAYNQPIITNCMRDRGYKIVEKHG